MMRATRHNRSGQALVEFGLVALVLYMLVGGAITFGLWIYAAGQIQQAANVGARELSQTPLPFDDTFEDALDQEVVRRRVYDDRWLVIDLDALEEVNPDYNFFTDVVPQMPLLNQQLALLYILDTFDHDNDDTTPPKRLMRYPGALLDRSQPVTNVEIDNEWVAQNYLVQIPIVIERKDVVEEMDHPDTNPEPFSLENPNENMRGVVALRIHYPAQSTWLSSFQDRGAFVPNLGDPNVADDDAVETMDDTHLRGSLIHRPLVFDNMNGDRIYAGTYGGKYGLGIHGAMTSPELTGSAIGIRPYRRVLVSHAIFRREVFTASSSP